MGGWQGKSREGIEEMQMGRKREKVRDVNGRGRERQ
jgi:hypothetical protein